ncbi:Ger(x)C family spore germination protein [Paenibacillus qinlingensis]|uniref:Spore germination protein n=1 Tax=Paenibacillus qinlingensis TaxID=1837343 RepID=A0ABU1NUL1_9BACL|nr:Ger(x)C family spore germination protein [Paenibacillus qinlingensis]MDR6550682.1 spore germination protein [Paenibacillus qinlingensis]
MQNKRLVGIGLCCLLLTGCAEKNIIEDLAILEAGAYDLSESADNPLTTTVLFPTVTKEGKVDTMTLTANGKSVHDTFLKIQNLTNLKLVGGQGTILFGEELLKKGLISVVKSFTRDPEIGTRVKFAIVEGNAGKLLKKKLRSVEDNAEYLYTFLDKAGKLNKALTTNQYRFLRDYYDDGIDPVLPVFSSEGDNFELKGLGIFKKDHYITHLSLSETQILNLLLGNIKHGRLMINMEEIGDHFQLLLNSVHSKNDKNMNSGNMSVEIRLDVKGSVLEYTGTMDLSQEKYQKELETQVEKYLITSSQKLLTKLQNYQTDPIGIGKVVRNHSSYEKWTHMNWNMIYPNLPITVKAKVDLVNIGKSK